MFAQLHRVTGGDFPFAAQDHGTERERLAQDAGQIGSHKAMLVEQVLEETEGPELWRSDGFLFPFFDQVAEQIEVVVLPGVYPFGQSPFTFCQSTSYSSATSTHRSPRLV